MPQLINTETNLFEEIPHEQMQEQLFSGKHNLPAGEIVNLLDPEGKLVGVPAEQVKDAVTKAEFKFPTSKDIEKYKNEQEFSGPGGAAAAAALGTFSGMGAGLPQFLEQHTPELAPSTPFPGAEPTPTLGSMIGKAHEGQPVAFGAGEFAGTLLPGAAITAPGRALTQETLVPAAEKLATSLANPENSPIVHKILSTVTKTGAKTLGSAVEAAPFGVPMTLSENALGNADLNAENLMHNVGYASLFGAALGGALGLGGELAGLRGKAASTAAATHSVMEDAANFAKEIPTGMPQTAEEIAARVQLGKEMGFESELPSLNRMIEVNDALAGESMLPVNRAQLKSFQSPLETLQYKALLRSGTKEGKLLQDYEATQKAEGVNKLLPKFVQEIAPENKLISSPIEAGEDAAQTFVKRYEAAKEAQKPIFDQIDKVGTNLVENLDELFNRVYEELPGAKDLIGIRKSGDETMGAYILRPYDATTGVAEGTYKQLRNVVRALNKEDLTIGGLRNLRDVMGDKIDWLKAPKEAAQLSRLRSNLMDYMQAEIDKNIPDIKVRDAMRRYAKNEENREIMEKIFGGSISDKAKFGKGIEPEKVLTRLFSSLENVKAAREILGPQEFNRITANYLSQVIEEAKDGLKGFKTSKVKNFLDSKNLILKEALAEKPEQLAKIEAIIDKMKALPDSPPGNPSETATFSRLLEQVHGLKDWINHPIMTAGKKILGTVIGSLDENARAAKLDRVLSGKELPSDISLNKERYTAFAKIERMANETARTISKNVSAIMNGTEVSVKGVTAAALTPKKYEEVSDEITKLANNPQKFIEDLQKASDRLHAVAPNTAAALHISAANATQFLASKLPVQESSDAFSTPHKPSSSEIAKFNRYYQVVQNPFVILHQIKTGTLTQESIETIKTVYPQLYGQMTNEIMGHLNPESVAKMPYSTKLMVSMFTGQELTKSLKASNIASAQMTSQLNKMDASPKVPHSAHSLSKIDMSNQSLTPLQRAQRR